DPDVIHSKTYQAARQQLPASNFENLTSLNDYRKRNYADPIFFQSRLKLYWVKPLYVALIFAFYKCGISLTTSALLPSLAGLAAMGFLFFSWMKKYLTVPFSAVICSLIMLSPPFWDAGRNATPDTLAGFMMLLSFYFAIERKNPRAALLLLLIATLIRIDVALLCAIMIIYYFITRYKEVKISLSEAMVFGTIAVVEVLIISFFTGNFGDNLSDFYNLAEATRSTGKNYFLKLGDFLTQLRYSHVTLFLAVMLI